MPDVTDRERSIAAYAGEVRAFHAFFGAVLIVMAALHLFVLLPAIQLRTAAPALTAALTAAEGDRVALADAEGALAASIEATARFRKALEAAPAELHAAVGILVAKGRTAAGEGGDPYAALIPSAQEAAQGRPHGEESRIAVEEAIRREIGRHVEALSVSFDGTLEPLRSLGNPPEEIGDVVRTAEEGLGRNILVLNEVLREAFAAQPGFWEDLGDPGATFAPASSRAGDWAKGTAEALRLLETRLAAATNTLKERGRIVEARRLGLTERNRELRARLAQFAARLAWLPLGVDGWARLYPLVAGVLSLTALFRLRRILLLRRALAGIDLDVMAPSWIVGPSSAPGRWWAMVLISLPVLATLHASATAAGDPALFAGVLGEPSPAARAVYGAAYAALSLVGIWQLVKVGAAVFAPAAAHAPSAPAHGNGPQ